MVGTLGSGAGGVEWGSMMGRVFLMVGTRLENKVVRVVRALRVSVFAGGSNGEDDVWWRAWVRSFAAATMMSVAEEVGI